MITAAMNGHLDAASYTEHPVFGLAMPTAVPGVPSLLLNPVSTWNSEEQYDKTALVLAHKFIANFNSKNNNNNNSSNNNNNTSNNNNNDNNNNNNNNNR